MEDKLKAIIARVEASALPEADKNKIYVMISEGMKASIWPALISSMPKDQLEALSKQTAKVTVESYTKLMEAAVGDEKVMAEVDETLNALIDQVDTALKEENI